MISNKETFKRSERGYARLSEQFFKILPCIIRVNISEMFIHSISIEIDIKYLIV